MIQQPECKDTICPAEEKHTPIRGGRVVTWGCIVAALILLANPMPMLLDILPDAIAYALILFALRRAVGEINVFNDLRAPTTKLLMVSLAKIPAFFIMMTIWGGNTSQRPIVGVFALVFSILEVIYLRSWVGEFFAATARYGQVFDCPAALAEGGRAFRISPEKLEKLTLIFFIIRSILSCLPEMTLVPVDDGFTIQIIKWNTLYFPLALISAFAVLIFGVIWCCYAVSYIRRIARDRDAEGRMAARVTVGSRAERENSFRLIRLAVIFFAAASLLQLDIVIDGVNYIPDLLSAICFFAAAYCLHGLLSKQWPLLITSGIYAASTVVYYVFHTMFYDNFTKQMIATNAQAWIAYRRLAIFSGVMNGLLVGVIVLSLLALFRVTTRYTGVVGGGLLHERMVAQLRHATPDETTALEHAYGNIEGATKRELRTKLSVSAGIGILFALLSFLDDFLIRYMERVSASPEYSSGYTFVSTFAWVGVAVWITGLLWFAISVHLASRIRQEAELNLIEE